MDVGEHPVGGIEVVLRECSGDLTQVVDLLSQPAIWFQLADITGTPRRVGRASAGSP